MRNKYLIYIISFLFLITSCSKKDIQLPLLASDGLSDIYNHSSIWLFFEKNGKDTLAVLNKNNKIINTHWLLNIDKRLIMKYVVPVLGEIQKAKYKPSMHGKEGTFIYFAYANTKSNNISLIEFKPTNFISSEKQVKDTVNEDQIIKINLQKDKILINNILTDLDHVKNILRDYKSKDSLNNSRIFLKYNEGISYQKYLQTKMILSKINMAIDSTENIYSIK
ncbi:MAG: hypothetical protein DRJ07_05105 [Bacteroidetes bacterium]|nr:MAG: hypothetical protein DRJ07_05105 [Bacteroidota bacterium]